MKETQRRIKEYQAKLPRMKEKVLAMVLLLAMSASMLVTVSFAWVSLSVNPEVSGVNTSVVSNGNLEIALASGLMSDPNDVAASAVGDSNLPLLERNITWGNLINLSDPAYGLDSLVLRPALLNKGNLLDKPLHGPIYDASGRVIDTNTNFGYAKMNELGVFEAIEKFEDQLGIRAITSMKYGDDGSVSKYYDKLDVIEAANRNNQTRYQNMANNSEYMDALSSMMAGYIVENIYYDHGSALVQSMLDHATLAKSDVEQFINMYDEMIGCLEEQATVIASILNLSAEVEAQGVEGYPMITAAELLVLKDTYSDKTAYQALKDLGFKTVDDSNSTVTVMKDIDQFLDDYNIMVEDRARLDILYNSISGRSVAWLDSVKVSADSDVRLIDDIIENLVDVKKCTISSSKQPSVILNNSGGGSILINLLGVTCETKIEDGILWNFDNRSGARLKNPDGKPLVINAGKQTLKSNVSTTATDNYFENERKWVHKRIEQVFGTAALVANDSYGFAIDFWVRTNAENSYLTLQGNVLTRTDTIEVTDKDFNGVEVPIYIISVRSEPEEGEAGEGGALDDLLVVTYDIYRSENIVLNAEGVQETVPCWRYANTHEVVPEELVAGYDDDHLPPRKVETIETPIGYEGDNRVWEGDEHAFLTVNSSTQGSGSCYVFYSENPVDQARIKVLLKSLKVAFIDDQGTLLAEAHMDVDLSYATTGKVIVPLVLDSESLSFGTDDDGDPCYAITVLERNVPKRITALVYLDGAEITNQDVLAAADIRGQMNIQFGSSVLLDAMDNEELYNSEIYVNAELEGDTEFEYGVDENMTTTVKVTVDGTSASTVEAYFIRKINSTQGSPETVFLLNDDNEDGVWEGSYTFRYPGEYILRSVRVDGVERELQLVGSESYPTVTVNGYTVTQVTYSVADGAEVMTDASTFTVDSVLRFATADPTKMPGKVVGQFLRDDGVVATVNYSYNPTTGDWTGRATFVSSGKYTMQYVMLDGKYTELNEANWCTVDLTLGLRVRVHTDSSTTIVYGTDETPQSIYMRVEILDNNGDPVENLGRAHLYYAASGSDPLHTSLSWNARQEYYEGEFNVEAGIWRFQKVEIFMGEGDGTKSTLTAVNSDAPVFTVIPPMPPSYYQTLGRAAQFMSNNADGTVMVSLWDSKSATVVAKLVRLDANGNPIAGSEIYRASNEMNAYEGTKNGEIAEYYTYTFPVGSGRWRVEEVSAFNVFDSGETLRPLPEDGTVDTADEFERGIVFAVTPLDIVVLKENDIRINVSYADDIFDMVTTEGTTTIGHFGKTASDGITSLFMDSHTIAAGKVTLNFTDDYGLIREGLFTVSDISMTYKQSAYDTKYGGYSSDTTTQAFVNSFTVSALSFTGENGVYTNSNPITLQYAAQYAVDGGVSYKVTDITSPVLTTTANNVCLIEVWSNKPTVKVTEVSPAPGTTFKINTSPTSVSGSGFTVMEGVFNTFTDYYATVFIEHTGTTSLLGQTWYNYEEPSVTLELSGMPSNFTNAKMVFDNINKPEYAVTYTFTPGNNGLKKTNAIGKVESSLLDGNPPVLYAGKQTVDAIDIVYNNITFTMNLSHEVTINQPLQPNNYATFIIDDATYSGLSPVKIYGDDDGTITLPTMSWNITETNNNITGDWVQQGTPSTRNVYTERTQTEGSGCNQTSTTYYTPYIETTTIYTASSTTTTATMTKRITGWVIDGVTYAPGAKINLSDNNTEITAVITTTSETTTAPSITTRTVIDYNENGDESTTKPGGSQVTSATGSITENTKEVN